jgi:nucleoside 2-deoxyribosyltransferase
MARLRIYLAGPDVFLPDAAAFAEAKCRLCDQYDFVGVSPFENGVDVATLPRHVAALQISAANEAMIRGCDLLIANLTPFRGPSADVGTVYEMGFARALGMPVLAYTNVAGNLLDRTRQALGTEIAERASGQFVDSFGMAIEDFDCVDNLMLVGPVEGSGAAIVVNPAPRDRRFTDLAGFEQCLRLAARNRDADASWAGTNRRKPQPS